jgi:hypothetical protein
VDTYGELNILITCHGLNKAKDVLEQSLEEWQAIMDANTKSVYLLSKYARTDGETGEGRQDRHNSSARSKRGMKGYTLFNFKGSRRPDGAVPRLRPWAIQHSGQQLHPTVFVPTSRNGCSMTTTFTRTFSKGFRSDVWANRRTSSAWQSF